MSTSEFFGCLIIMVLLVLCFGPSVGIAYIKRSATSEDPNELERQRKLKLLNEAIDL